MLNLKDSKRKKIHNHTWCYELLKNYLRVFI
nr:MAG TPA: hypothetical protein [Bacteriophage sp.]